MKPIIRRVYAPRGEPPMVSVNPRYEWLYVYAFVHPNSGRSVWYLLPALNTAAFQAVLENFALDVLSQAGKRVLVVLDNAAWHKSKTSRFRQGWSLCFCRRTRRSCNRRSGCGRCVMRRLSIAACRVWWRWGGCWVSSALV
ncbi:MAG: hypothetical protein HC933_11480 [Pleurocapsa sp. SU_196_0]|nr:hypothetical protein [Pleurocapsa sp. SU_196_0]